MKRRMHNLNYLKPRRRALRNNGTCAEALLWTRLKCRQLQGRKFRRQHSIKNFIVDFYCPEERLIVELDGQIHDSETAMAYDTMREEQLKSLGFRILRIENKLIFKQLEAVLEDISACFRPLPPPL